MPDSAIRAIARGTPVAAASGAARRGRRRCGRPCSMADTIRRATSSGSSIVRSRARRTRAKAASLGPCRPMRSIISEATGPISTASVPTGLPRRSARRPEVAWVRPALLAP